MSSINTDLHYIWEGGISPTRLDVLKTCVYSAKYFNPNRNVIIWSNSLDKEQFLDYDIEIRKYGWDIFQDLPLDIEIIKSYYADKIDDKIQLKCYAREYSDLLRLIILYKFGGSYIDTDDICIKTLPDTQNVVCRSYDPHTHFYSKVPEDRLLEGKYREVKGYDHLRIYPRNDCWLNWQPKSDFLYRMLSDERLNNSQKSVYIGDELSFQSLTLDVCNQKLDTIGKDWNLYLTLIYIYEGHVSVCSGWDLGHFGGEMHDIWNTLPRVKDYEWSKYKCTKDTWLNYYEKIRLQYPLGCFIWLQDKDMIPEYFEERKEVMLMSSQIYHYIKSLL